MGGEGEGGDEWLPHEANAMLKTITSSAGRVGSAAMIFIFLRCDSVHVYVWWMRDHMYVCACVRKKTK